MASGMAHLASLIEKGMTHRDAVAQIYKENRSVIFTGNGYSAEWPVEAAKRGLPNLNTTPLAVATFNSKKAKDVFSAMGVFADDECDARQEVMYENYNTVLSIEVETMIKMVETGILPACAQDMASYAAMPSLAGDRSTTYEGILSEAKKLKDVFAAKPHDDLAKEAEYLCNTVKPQMAKVRDVVDKAEGLLQKGLYPYPTYEDLIYSHHS
jgi:glutamine synthetase